MRQVLYVILTFVCVLAASLIIFKPVESQKLPLSIPWFEFSGAGSEKFTKNDLKNHWTVAYFGYTSCPDLCPATLKVAKLAAESLRKDGPSIPQLQLLFVSLDPSRDSPEKARDYAKFFHPEFIGVTASLTDPKELLATLGASLGDDRHKNPENYRVFHPTSLYIFNPKAQFVGEIKDPHLPKQMVSALTKVVVGGASL